MCAFIRTTIVFFRKALFIEVDVLGHSFIAFILICSVTTTQGVRAGQEMFPWSMKTSVREDVSASIVSD